MLVTADSAERVNTDFFFPGQTFWLKRTAGPIVATATLDRWIAASRRDWTRRDLLHATAGYPIARHRAFWKTLDDHPGHAFLLLYLKDTCALDVPIYPTAEAYGRRVIALSDYAQHIGWLYSDGCVLNLPAPTVKEQPIALRYQFRWEPLLSPEVSMRLTERTRRGGRFRDRVEALNGALLEYFTFLDTVAERETLDLFTEDQLCLLVELNEGCEAEPDRIARLADTLLDLGGASVYSASTGIDSAEMLSLSETLRQLSPDQSLLLLDALRRRAATCPAPVRGAWLENRESNLDDE